MDPLQSSLQYLKGVGPRRAADLERVGLHTVEDLLYRFPIRYEDRGSFQTIASLKPGMSASVVGEVVASRHPSDAAPALQDLRAARPRSHRLAARHLVQPAVPQRRLPSAPARHPVRQARAHVARAADAEPAVRDPAAGEADDWRKRTARVADDETLHTGRIVPIYEKTGTLTTKMQRVLVHHALAQLPDVAARIRCPPRCASARGLLDRRTAIGQAHFPPEHTAIATS